MARRKRTSTILEDARKRMAGLKSITPPPNFGTNLQLADYEQKINDFSAKIDRYNQLLSSLDDLQNDIVADEKELRTINSRMLSASEAQYGPDSSQYEQAGGIRRSERQKRTTKKTPSKEVLPEPAKTPLVCAPSYKHLDGQLLVFVANGAGGSTTASDNLLDMHRR